MTLMARDDKPERDRPGEPPPVDRPSVDPNAAKAWRKPRLQIGALPFRFDDDGQLRVLLITSRESRRWVIPKGWPVRGLKPHRAAEREAFEEAGLKGRIGKSAIGAYLYEKRLSNGLAVPCEVSVFPLQVTGQRKRWPEMGQRDGRWVGPDEAAGLVQEEGLQALLRGFAPAPRARKARRKRTVPSKLARRSGGRRKAHAKRPKRNDREAVAPA
jgi:8-oxo-dGTP pyrophosphatase MutT (NUDIX family)